MQRRKSTEALKEGPTHTHTEKTQKTYPTLISAAEESERNPVDRLAPKESTRNIGVRVGKYLLAWPETQARKATKM